MLHNGLWHIRNKTKPIRLEGHNALFCRLLYVCTCAELVILGSASAACAENMDLAKALQQKLMSQARTRPKGQTQHAQNDWDGLVNILIYIYILTCCLGCGLGLPRVLCCTQPYTIDWLSSKQFKTKLIDSNV